MWPIAMSRESVPCGCQQPPKSTANLSIAMLRQVSGLLRPRPALGTRAEECLASASGTRQDSAPTSLLLALRQRGPAPRVFVAGCRELSILEWTLVS